MKGVNKVILVATLGKDPEVNAMPSGSTVTNASMATSESWKDKNTGEKVEKTEWHRVTFFGKLAEIAGQYLKKGSKVYIEGRIQTDKYQAQDGTDRYSTKIIANQMQMLDSRDQQSAPQSQHDKDKSNGYQPQKVPEFDDDIPF